MENIKIKQEPVDIEPEPQEGFQTSTSVEVPLVPVKVEEKQFFECRDCGLKEEYDYFGKTPPFCRSIKFLEDSFVARDPFTAHSGNNANFLLLGSKCTLCSNMTCQECSVFFTKRFCAQCYKECSSQLPEELLKAKKKAKD